MRALTVHPRHSVFSILDTLVSKYRESAPSVSGGLDYWTDEITYYTGLKSMAKEFVSGYLNIADGEKDPRNLLLAFSINRVLLIEFDISSHVAVSFILVLVRSSELNRVTRSPSSMLLFAISQSPSDRRRTIHTVSHLSNSRRNCCAFFT